MKINRTVGVNCSLNMFCGWLYFVYCMLWLHVPLNNNIVIT